MNKTKIEWTDYTWNPIKGLCPVDCKLPDGRSYCYGKRIYERFKLYSKERFSLLECAKPLHLKKPSKIFVCSTFELFHPVINDRQRELIFRIINKCPQHAFQILTKFPENIDKPMPDNVWLGVTVTEKKDLWRVKKLHYSSGGIKFVSIEPLLSNIFEEACLQYGIFENINWVIVGRLTGFGKKYDPDINSIMNIVELCIALNIPIFFKNNLESIWGENLIQEFPKNE